MYLCHLAVSSGGSGASRWDPDLLKTDVVMARNRVGRLKRELHQIKHEVANTEAGMQTLAQWVVALCVFDCLLLTMVISLR